MRSIPQDEEIKILSGEKIPEKGVAIHLKSSTKKLLYFTKIEYNRKNYLFSINESDDKLRFVADISGSNKVKNFKRGHLIVTSETLAKGCHSINTRRAIDEYFIPNYLQNCSRTQKSSIALVGNRISQKVFAGGTKWPAVKKINFSENDIDKIDEIC